MRDRKEQIYDQLLVLRCQEGVAAAFEELVGRWQERLWRHAWRLTNNEEAAWDALQEAWISISAGIGRLRDTAAFSAWAYRIVGNKACDWVRRDARRRKALRGWEEKARQEADDRSAANARGTGLREAVENLPGAVRALLSLHYEEGFRMHEIAAILGVSEGTVKSRLYHARQKLRKTMEEKDDG
jgi:RNA polymerase sigma-70 factor (ECF subfamily)